MAMALTVPGREPILRASENPGGRYADSYPRRSTSDVHTKEDLEKQSSKYLERMMVERNIDPRGVGKYRKIQKILSWQERYGTPANATFAAADRTRVVRPFARTATGRIKASTESKNVARAATFLSTSLAASSNDYGHGNAPIPGDSSSKGCNKPREYENCAWKTKETKDGEESSTNVNIEDQAATLSNTTIATSNLDSAIDADCKGRESIEPGKGGESVSHEYRAA